MAELQDNKYHIPPDKIASIESLPIADVVQRCNVVLKRRGANYVGMCPFHTDTNPSFYVNSAKNLCKCFACGEGGNTISFVKKSENVAFHEAVYMLADWFNIDIPRVKLTPEDELRAKRKESQYIVLDKVQEQFRANLDSSADAKNYLMTERGFTQETIDKFGLGYATGDNQITKTFPNKGYKVDIMLASGIIGQNDTGQTYDRFRNRIQFPFHDMRGRVIGFTGRDLTGTAASKYSNSPSTDLYNKSEELYGLYQAKKRILEAECVYVVEGQPDTISFHQHKVENTIAASGTAFTQAQMKRIRQFASTIIFIYDGDKAGLKAAIKHIQGALEYGFDVKAFALPEGMDPDDFARDRTERLASVLVQDTKSFYSYLYQVLGTKGKKDADLLKDLDLICECVSLVPDKSLRDQYISSIGSLFGMGADEVMPHVKLQTKRLVEKWNDGFYGVDEAVALLAEKDKKICDLTFDKKRFCESVAEDIIISVSGTPEITQRQTLRSKMANISFVIAITENIAPEVNYENENLLFLKAMHKEGFNILVYNDDAEKYYSFSDWYIAIHADILDVHSPNAPVGEARATLVARCIEVISNIPSVERTILIDGYAERLKLKSTRLNELLKPVLSRKKDSATRDLLNQAELIDIPEDPSVLPEYVTSNPDLLKLYYDYGFYPRYSKGDARPVGYMFKNESNGHSNISDFYFLPHIHVYDKESKANKRIVELCHQRKSESCFVEWQSNTFTNLNKLNESLFNEGAFNFEGSVKQYNKIKKYLSYNFTKVYELRTLGWQPEGFWNFANAIYHQVEDKATGEFKWQLDYMDEVGVVSHNGKNYYSPAFSKIHIEDRNVTNAHEQDINFRYKKVPENKAINFNKWTTLMNKVYKLNDNGKWAIMFTVNSAIRDLIFEKLNYFYGFFLVGPTSAGKTKLAESVRNVFMDSKSDTFNLNTGTYASLTALMERYSNVALPLEEYNDKHIDDQVFQALKAATHDGVGRTKMADVAAKTTSSSKVTVALMILGQEASQTDDGALPNRGILKEVPTSARGEFTDEETKIFLELKEYEKNGLSDVLLEILQLRPLFAKHFTTLFAEENKKIKEAIKSELNNTEGLIRILNSATINVVTCRIIEEYSPLELPFTYAEFFIIACNQITEQLEKIATTNKLGSFFNAIDTLLTRGTVVKNRDLSVEVCDSITRQKSGKESEMVILSKPNTKILFLSLNMVYKQYVQMVGGEAAKESTLATNFRSHPAFRGYIRAKRFSWMDHEYGVRGSGYIPKDDDTVTPIADASMKLISKTHTKTAYMFDYDILSEMMHIDLEHLTEEAIAEQLLAKNNPTDKAPITAFDTVEE